MRDMPLNVANHATDVDRFQKHIGDFNNGSVWAGRTYFIFENVNRNFVSVRLKFNILLGKVDLRTAPISHCCYRQ